MPDPNTQSGRVLRIIRYHSEVTDLVRPVTRHDDDAERLFARAAELETALGDRRNSFARIKSDLDAFEVDYRKRVGTLHEQLDALELAIAESELGELSKRMASGAGGSRGRAFSRRWGSSTCSPAPRASRWRS